MDVKQIEREARMRRLLIEAREAGATMVGLKVDEPDGRWRQHRDISDHEGMIRVAHLIAHLQGEPETWVEWSPYSIDPADGEQVWYEWDLIAQADGSLLPGPIKVAKIMPGGEVVEVTR
jgi:hypothetical protein